MKMDTESSNMSVYVMGGYALEREIYVTLQEPCFVSAENTSIPYKH
jgi:hypothetical protein